MNEDYDLKQMFVDIKNHIGLEVDYGKLTMVEKVSILLSRIALVCVLTIICSMAFFYISSILVSVIVQATGIEWLGYLSMFLLLALFGVLVYAFRKPWIIDPISRFVSKLFLNPGDDERK